MKTRVNLFLIVVGLVGLALELSYFAHAFGNQWWIMTLVAPSLIVLPTLYSIFFATARKTAFILIFLLALFVYSIYPLYSRDFSYVPSRDPSFNYQVFNEILKQHLVPFGQGQGLAIDYSCYPAMHIFLAIIGMISDFDPIILLKMSTLFFMFTPFVVYLIARKIFASEKIGQVAAFIYTFTPLLYPIATSRTFGLFFFSLVLLSLFSSKEKSGRKGVLYVLVGSIFCFVLSAGHFLTLVILLAILFVTGIVRFIPRKVTKGKLSGFSAGVTLLMLSIGFSWINFFSLPTVSNKANIAVSFVEAILSGTNSIVFRPSLSGFTEVEQTFITFSFLSMLLLGAIGFVLYLKGRNDASITSVFLFLGFLFVFFYAFSNRNENLDYLSQRMWSYLFVVLAPLAAYAVSKSKMWSQSSRKLTRSKLIQSVFILLVLSSSAYAFVYSIPRYYYNFNLESETGLLTSMRGYGEKEFSSVQWYNNYSDPSFLAIGDAPIRDLGGAFKESASNIILDYSLYYNQSQLVPKNVKYVFIDYLLSIYDQGPSWKQYVPKANSTYLTYLATNQSSWDRIYDNSLVCIMYVSG